VRNLCCSSVEIECTGLDILKIDKNSTDLWYFIFQFRGLTAPKPPVATKLGPEQLNDEGALEIAREVCD